MRKAKERREKGLPVVEEVVVPRKKVEKKAAPVVTRKRQASEAVSGSEEEEEAPKGKGKGKAKEVAVPAARKRLRSASVQPHEDSDEEERPAVTTTKKKSTTPAPSTSTAAAAKPGTKKAEQAAKKQAKEKQAELEANLLIVKPKRSTKAATAAVDQAFADDFNALKIVRPKLVAMKQVEKHRMGWDELDPDEEMNRLIREEEEWRDDPEKWEGKATQMFVVRDLQLERKERGRENSALELPEQWRGRPNFKKFKVSLLLRRSLKSVADLSLLLLHSPRTSKILVTLNLSTLVANRSNSSSPNSLPSTLASAKVSLLSPALPPTLSLISLAIAPRTGYTDKRKIAFRPQDDDEDDSELSAGDSPKLNFKKLGAAAKKKAAPAKATAAKGKGKAKKLVSESEDDDVEMLDLDSVEEEEEEEAQPKSRAKAKAPAKAKAAPKKAAPKKAAAASAPKKKAVETMLVLDSDDDDDDGLTFKGFGAKKKR